MEQPRRGLLLCPDDRPSWGLASAVAAQHVLMVTGFFFVMTEMCEKVGMPTGERFRMIQICTLACAGGVALMSAKTAGFGTGALCTQVCATAYLAPAVAAFHAGGLPLLAGLTVFAAFVQILFASVIPKLQRWLPTEILGLAIIMQGIYFVRVAGKQFEGFGTDSFGASELAISGGVLALVVGLSVYGRGGVRLLGVLIATACGLIACAVLCPGTYFQGKEFLGTSALVSPWFSLPPIGFSGLSLGNGDLLLTFSLTSVAAAIKAMGDLSVLQKIAEPSWRSPDYRSLRKGVLSNGLGLGLAGLLGAFPLTASATSVGIAFTTGAVARRIGYVLAGCLLALSFFPRLLEMLQSLPSPVTRAMTVFVACFNLAMGLQIVLSRVLDVRRSFAIGLPMLFGMSIVLTPGLYKQVPSFLQPLLAVPMVATVLVAVVANFLMSIGLSKRVQRLLDADDMGAQLKAFVEDSAGAWSIRQDAALLLTSLCDELAEILRRFSSLEKPPSVSMKYSDGYLNFELRHSGSPIIFPGNKGSNAGELSRNSAMSIAAQDLRSRFPDLQLATEHGIQTFTLELQAG